MLRHSSPCQTPYADEVPISSLCFRHYKLKIAFHMLCADFRISSYQCRSYLLRWSARAHNAMHEQFQNYGAGHVWSPGNVTPVQRGCRKDLRYLMCFTTDARPSELHAHIRRLDTVDRHNLDETRIILLASELSDLLLDIEELMILT